MVVMDVKHKQFTGKKVYLVHLKNLNSVLILFFFKSIKTSFFYTGFLTPLILSTNN